MKHEKIRCRSCGMEFEPYHLVNQDYCSNTCRQKAFADRIKREHGCSPVTYYKRLRARGASEQRTSATLDTGGDLEEHQDARPEASTTARCSMRAVRIDDAVWSALQKRARAFEDTPNSVLRRVLGIDRSNGKRSAANRVPRGVRTPQSLCENSVVSRKMAHGNSTV